MINHVEPGRPSPWIARHLERAAPGQTALDVATGRGRHLRLAHALGYAATGIDRDISGVADLIDTPGINLIQADLEDGSPWPLASLTFDVVIVTNYLYRPRLSSIVSAVAPGGLLLYETFALGNERFGRPANPDFLLRPGELLDAVQGRLTPIAFEHLTLDNPSAVVQRIAAAGSGHRWMTDPPLGSGVTR